MRKLILSSAFLLSALTLGGCGSSGGGGALPQHIATTSSAARVLRAPLGATSIISPTASAGTTVPLCAKPADGAHAGCFATVRTDSVVTSQLTDDVNGLTPRDLSLLYAYPAPGSQGTAGSKETVAVVEAGNYAAAQSDLAVYRAHFGLPACTTANGCLRTIVAPSSNLASLKGNVTSIVAFAATTAATGWAAETDTDTEIVSAVCPNCKIIITEAASNSIADLSTAVASAAAAGATVVNASFGAPEVSIDTNYSWLYANGNVKVVAAAGDWGYGVSYPASDINVTAVGGTSLSVDGTTVSEKVWSETGSGCSAYFQAPQWKRIPQLSNSCWLRNVADIAAVADPNTGVAVYDSSLNGSTGGWAIFGGTSVSAPIIAAMYALSGDTVRNWGAETFYEAASKNFLPVTSGSNGSCSPAYLCTAVSGYNGPTGLGVPQGLGGF